MMLSLYEFAEACGRLYRTTRLCRERRPRFS
jgi:hypothetical protein